MSHETKALLQSAMAQAKAIPAFKTQAEKRRAISAMLETHKAALRADGWV